MTKALTMTSSLPRSGLVACVLALSSLSALAQVPAAQQAWPGTITLAVDATDLDHKLLRVRETLPVTAGPVRLLFPHWLPGQHGPSGAVSQLAGLKISAAGRPLAWVRDAVEMTAFDLVVPAGVTQLDIEFQFATSMEDGAERLSVTPDLLGLQWNSVLLYPAGPAVGRIGVQPSLTLPEGWQAGTALEVAGQRGSTLDFKPTSVETLVDSPVFAGRHVHRYDLDPGAAAAGRAPVALTVVSDRASQGEMTPAQLAVHRALVTQADKVFASRHYAHYDFLLGVSDQFSRIGLEHHQSSENGVKGSFFTDWDKWASARDLLPHEYTHSWNGKFRRPADLWTPDFNAPMRDSLLWVYEGQTQYWGQVLAARSGLVSAADIREDLAEEAARLQVQGGRAWRNLQDTTNEPILQNQPGRRDWRTWQRSFDFYDEGALIWLEADMLIRQKSGGKRSLDDFARRFFGAEPARVAPLTYTFDDVVLALDKVQPFDWAGFLRERLDTHEAPALLNGLAASGWTLAWRDTPSDYLKAKLAAAKRADFSHSLGLVIGEGGKLASVAWNSPAFRAGAAPTATLLAVDGRAYTEEVLKEAISLAVNTQAPIALLVKAGDRYRTLSVDWHGGLRYPTLQRVAGTPDRLGQLLAPLP